MLVNLDDSKSTVRRVDGDTSIVPSKLHAKSSSSVSNLKERCGDRSTSKSGIGSHHEMIKAIVNDDDLFRELKARLRKSRVVTNQGIAVALHCSILDSMLPEIESIHSKWR